MLRYLNIAGFSISVYKVFNNLSAVVLLWYVFSQISDYVSFSPRALKHKRPKLVGIIEIATIGIPFFILFSILNPAFGDWFTEGNANYYGNLTAWLVMLTVVPMILRVSPLKTLDLFSPGLAICLFLAKLACFFHGCCHGFELSGGFYFNHYTECYEFPVQLVEALIALALFFFIRWYAKRNKHVGSVFPVYLSLYSVSRFLTEFLRADLPNVVGPFDAYQVMSVVFALVGLFLLYNVWIVGDKIQEHYDRVLKEQTKK